MLSLLLTVARLHVVPDNVQPDGQLYVVSVRPFEQQYRPGYMLHSVANLLNDIAHAANALYDGSTSKICKTNILIKVLFFFICFIPCNSIG